MSLAGQLALLSSRHNPITRVLALMNLRFFMDEAGHQADQPAFCLGGLIGDVTAWDEIVGPFKTALGPVPYFHATEFAASQGYFKGWGPQRKQELLDQLMPLLVEFLQKPGSWAIGVGFYTEDYNRTVGKFAQPLPDPFCLIEALRMMTERLPPLGDDERIPVMLERKKEVQEQMDDEYLACLTSYPKAHLGPLSFGEKKCTTELQIADLVIYELFRMVKRLNEVEATGDNPGELRPVAQALYESKKCAFRGYSFEALRQTAINIMMDSVRQLKELEPPVSVPRKPEPES